MQKPNVGNAIVLVVGSFAFLDGDMLLGSSPCALAAFIEHGAYARPKTGSDTTDTELEVVGDTVGDLVSVEKSIVVMGCAYCRQRRLANRH